MRLFVVFGSLFVFFTIYELLQFTLVVPRMALLPTSLPPISEGERIGLHYI